MAEITGFTLVDAEKDTDISPLGDFIVSDSLLSIRVDVRKCFPKIVTGVRIQFDNETRCERHLPYTSFGDPSKRDKSNRVADYLGRKIPVGQHVIKATPYTERKCSCQAGTTVELIFEVKEIRL